MNLLRRVLSQLIVFDVGHVLDSSNLIILKK